MDINPLNRPGEQLLNNADPFKLFLIEFSGLVLNRFKEATKFLNRHVLRTIDHGRGERFDALGEATAIYHVPGTDLSDKGRQIKHDAFDILVDPLLIAPMYLDAIDDAMNHFELKNRYAGKLGFALARSMDANIAQCAILAARHAARVPDGFGGSQLVDANMATDAEVLFNSLYDAKVVMDQKDVPPTGRTAAMLPEYASMLARNFDALNSLYGGTGSVKEGEVLRIAGFDIVPANDVPSTNVTNTINHKYDGDFTKTVAVCFTDEAVGTVQLKGLTAETAWDHNRQAWFLAAKLCVGHGVLRPECAVELAVA